MCKSNTQRRITRVILYKIFTLQRMSVLIRILLKFRVVQGVYIKCTQFSLPPPPRKENQENKTILTITNVNPDTTAWLEGKKGVYTLLQRSCFPFFSSPNEKEWIVTVQSYISTVELPPQSVALSNYCSSRKCQWLYCTVWLTVTKYVLLITLLI